MSRDTIQPPEGAPPFMECRCGHKLSHLELAEAVPVVFAGKNPGWTAVCTACGSTVAERELRVTIQVRRRRATNRVDVSAEIAILRERYDFGFKEIKKIARLRQEKHVMYSWRRDVKAPISVRTKLRKIIKVAQVLEERGCNPRSVRWWFMLRDREIGYQRPSEVFIAEYKAVLALAEKYGE